jgi:hypothetical protein
MTAGHVLLVVSFSATVALLVWAAVLLPGGDS